MIKKFLNSFLFMLLISVFISLIVTYFLFNSQKFSPFNITSYSLSAVYNTSEDTSIEISNEEKEKYKKLYDVNFIMKKNPSGNITMFLPSNKSTSLDTATYYADFFSMDKNFSEDNDKYIFEDNQGNSILEIDKFNSSITYENTPQTLDTPEPDSLISPNEDAIKIATKFLQHNIPDFTYEEAILYNEFEIINILFISRLENLKNYAFPTEVQLDKHGNILKMKYWHTTYEKLDNIKIKSMSDAFYSLPLDLPEDTVVDLKKCTLVYHYENSIIQPAYLFEGELPEGKSFQCFVNATLYN